VPKCHTHTLASNLPPFFQPIENTWEFDVAGAEHFKKTGRMGQMEITALEGDNVFSGRPNLHPELPQANIVALFYTAYDVASSGWRGTRM
jgi:hypothetical protein